MKNACNNLRQRFRLTHQVIRKQAHQFGRNREGDINFLKESAAIFDFEVVEISVEEVFEVNVSSTKIRNSILDGNILRANEFLGRPFQIEGEVVKGNELGRDLGFPTINLKINNQNKILPCDGVYAVRVFVMGTLYEGMMNIGQNPTVKGEGAGEKKYEVHIFDFNEDVYGHHVTISFYQYVRKEKSFDNLEELKLQIQSDEKDIRAFFTASID